MPINVRVTPEWTDFVPRLVEAIQREQLRDGFNQDDKEETLFLNVHPSIQFHYSCAPLHHIHCITSYSGCSGNVVLGFKWGQTEFKHQIETWVDDGQGSLQHHSTIPVYGRYKIELMQYIPNRGILVGYCNDVCLRLLTDNTQEMVMLCQAECPASVASMLYCPETGELLTGSMGLVAFWGFYTSTQSPLSLLRTLDWTSSSLQRDMFITGFVAQPQTSSVYVLCSHNVKSFDHAGQRELFEFRGRSVATLRCAVLEWRQRYLYTGDAEGYIQVWSYDTRCLFLQFRAHPDAVTSVVLMPESGTILSASTSCWIKQWTRSGDLLLKLHTDMAGGVRSMWTLGNNVILSQSSNSLDVWRLNSIYRSFNDTACSVRVLRRLECGRRGKARILAVTQDGIIRFFSPVTGELLFLSWPFLHIDKALGFAYDPLREELYICDGSVDVHVLDTTLNPCPVKHVLNTVKDGNDEVLCLATVFVWSSQDGAAATATSTSTFAANESLCCCLVFSGHCSGKLQLLAPLGLRCNPGEAHSGPICQMSTSSSSTSGGGGGQTAVICCYGTDKQFTLWSVAFRDGRVHLTLSSQIFCPFTPVHCRVLRGGVCAVSPQQDMVVYSLRSGGQNPGRPIAIKRDRSQTISCLDYCPELDVLAVSGPSGKVEFWNPVVGELVAEVQLGVPVTQLCFGNARGDLLASFSDSVSIVSVAHVLPTRYLRRVLEQAPPDDVAELPAPFLPKSPSHYDISTVGKIYMKHVETGRSLATETIRDPMLDDNMAEKDAAPAEDKYAGRKSIIRPFPFVPFRRKRQSACKSASTTEEEPDEMEEDDVSEEAVMQAQSFEDTVFSLFRHIAPDGYIPNSVVRGHHTTEHLEEEQKWTYEVEEIPQALLRDYYDLPEENLNKHSEEVKVILTRTKQIRIQNAQQQMMKSGTTAAATQEVAEEGQGITGVQHIDKVPDGEDEMVVQRLNELLGKLETSSEEDYKAMSDELITVLKQIKDEAFLERVKDMFLDHAMDGSMGWRQLQGLNNLRRLCLLHRGDIATIAQMLVHLFPELRNLAGSILQTEFYIFDKQTLASRLQGVMSPKEMKTLLSKLTEDLNYVEDNNSVIKHKKRSKKADAEMNESSSTQVFKYTTMKRMSDAKGNRRRSRKRSTLCGSCTSEDLLAGDEQAKKDTHADMQAEGLGSIGKRHPDAQSKQAKSKRATKERGASLKLPQRPTLNPRLHAYRQSFVLDRFQLDEMEMEADMAKCKSRLPPIDSGCVSLADLAEGVHQKGAEQKVGSTTKKRGGLIPIGKPKRAEHHYNTPVPCHYGSALHDGIHSQNSDDIILNYDVISSQRTSRAEQHDVIGQRPSRAEQHDVIGQRPSRAEQNDVISQRPYRPEQHDVIGQRPSRAEQHDIISQRPYRAELGVGSPHAEHPQGPRHPLGHVSHLYPQGGTVLRRPGELGEGHEQGDSHWRQSLHKLISLNGFRSRKAEKAAAPLLCSPPPPPPPPARMPQRPTGQKTTLLPPLHQRALWQGAPGERVAERVELTTKGGGGGGGGGSANSNLASAAALLKFQNEIPLPWRLSHFPLRSRGHTRYGKLEVGWVRSGGGVQLPNIDPTKRSLSRS
ncbi:uncharacterized protein LOC134448246 [Engraulis encrasicolus]|uniref:uncharacterized protein LOC134448246 n=1 Tax=Engraulis encrasicolus TaxID=184585 RepID=UPI002FD65254